MKAFNIAAWGILLVVVIGGIWLIGKLDAAHTESRKQKDDESGL